MRAGTRRLVVATAAACLAAVPLAYDAAAHADGPGGAAASHDHGTAAHRTAGRHDESRRAAGDERQPAGRDHGSHRRPGPVVPRTKIVFNAQAPHVPITPGGTYQWPYTVTNQGPGPARDVALTARPNRHLKVVATQPQCRWTSHNNLVCRIGLIPGGETKKGAITAQVDKKAPVGKPLSNPVRLSWDGRPDSASRYSGLPPVVVSQTAARAAESATGTVRRTAGADAKNPFEVLVTKNGPVTAEGLVVRKAVAGRPAESGCTGLLSSLGGLLGRSCAGTDTGRGQAGAACTGISCNAVCALGTCEVSARTDPPACGACALPACNTCTKPGVTPVTAPAVVTPPGKSAGAPPAENAREVAQPIEVPVVPGHRPGHPIGAVPPGRAHPPAGVWPHGPHGLSCAETPNVPGCHTRAAHPVAPGPAAMPGHRLPNTGFAYGLFGLCGAGLTGLGLVLYWMGRVRRGRRERVAMR